MIYDKIIEGKYVNLRSVLEDDIQFTYDIRKDPQFNGYVGCLAENLEAQRKYIISQMDKEGDYYFVIENKKGERIGLIGIYDIHGKVGEEGRTVSYGSPLENIEATLLLEGFARDVLGLEIISISVYADNKKIIHGCIKAGFEVIRKDIRSGKNSVVMEISCKKDNPRRKKYLEMIKKYERYNI